MNLRKVYKEYSRYNVITAKKLQKHVLKEFSERKQCISKFADAVLPESEIVSDAEIESLFERFK
jgi:hypothetical protein